jgi:3-phosphoshikimate 1-carboxyvinyltransferase
MRHVIRPPSRIEGTVVLPGDKSISQRAVLLNSIAGGSATVSNFSSGHDAASMVRGLRALGARIQRLRPAVAPCNGVSLVVRGMGRYGLSEPSRVLNVGNSGTAMRMLAGLMAAQPFFGVISGDRSLRSRPMTRIVRPLTQMGAQIMGRGDSSLAPLAIRGGELKAIDYTLPVASSQLKSSILIAGLYAVGQTAITQPAASRDHTERMLRSMGADLEVEGLRVAVRPSELSSLDVRVPGDISAAAFWLVAACCHPSARIRVQGVGINPTRTGVLDVLKAMGARIRLENVRDEGGEPVADLIAESSDLAATEIRGDTIPQVIDELPVLALAACFARGTTLIGDAAELRVKESDRIRSTVRSLSSLGAKIEERPDGMVIQGVNRLAGSECNSEGDHRIAMTLGIAGLLTRGETVVGGAEAASVSYPDFWDTLASLAPSQQVVS